MTSPKTSPTEEQRSINNARARTYYANNREQCRAKARAYYWAHREARQAYDRHYRATHDRSTQHRAQQLARYSLTEPEYQVMLAAQGGVCAICKGVGDRRLCVDHDHTTGAVRGLLCDKCNHALDLLGDSIDLLAIAAQYLQQFIGARS